MSSSAPVYQERRRPGSRPCYLCDPVHGVGERSGPSGRRFPYLSANRAASLKMLTNIWRVNFPVCVFWLEG